MRRSASVSWGTAKSWPFSNKKVYCISWLTSCTSKFHSDVFAMISLWISSEEAAKLTVQLPVIWDVLRLLWQVSPWHMAFGNQRAIYTVTWLMVILTSSVVLEKHLVTCPYITQWRHYIDPWKYNNEVGVVILSNLREVDFSDVWHKEAFGSIKSCLFENGQLHWNWKKWHVDEIFLTGFTEGCHFDNLRCNHWENLLKPTIFPCHTHVFLIFNRDILSLIIYLQGLDIISMFDG